MSTNASESTTVTVEFSEILNKKEHLFDLREFQTHGMRELVPPSSTDRRSCRRCKKSEERNVSYILRGEETYDTWND